MQVANSPGFSGERKADDKKLSHVLSVGPVWRPGGPLNARCGPVWRPGGPGPFGDPEGP